MHTWVSMCLLLRCVKCPFRQELENDAKRLRVFTVSGDQLGKQFVCLKLHKLSAVSANNLVRALQAADTVVLD